MSSRRRRFLSVTLAATVVDLGVFIGLAHFAGANPLIANFVALSAAALASNLLHLVVTFPDSPYIRWLQRPLAFLAVAVAAGITDLLVLDFRLNSLEAGGSIGLGELLQAKAVALVAAAVLRVFAYRWFLFRILRQTLVERRERGPAPGDYRLSVVVPAYGEEGRIGQSVEQIRADLTPHLGEGELEIVVVDDGSPDATAEEARTAGADQVVTLNPNEGKGGAVRAGMLVAQGRTVSFTDADLAYSPDQLLGLLAEVEDGWDVVVGSRRHELTSTLVKARRLREVGGRVINALTQIVLLGQYRDTQCGIKAFRSDVARLVFGRTRVTGFAFDVEVFHLVERYGLSLSEVPVTVVNSERSTVHVVRDAWRLVRDLIRIRLWARQGAYEVNPEMAATEELELLSA